MPVRPHCISSSLYFKVHMRTHNSVPIDVGNLQRFTVKNAAVDPGAPSKLLPNGESLPRSRRRIEYNSISHDVKDEIESFEVAGSYGSKIETLVRHLLYLEVTDPGAKSIVFSAWADSLLSAFFPASRRSCRVLT